MQMMNVGEWAGATQALIGAFGLAFGAIVTWRKARSEETTSAAERVETHMGKQDERMERLEARLDASVVRERIRDDYIAQLRQHIVDGNPPPPPVWPAELRTLAFPK